MATTNDIKNGSVLNLDGQLWNVIEFQHVKPGKGGAFVRTKLKNVMSGKVVDKTFNAGTKIDFANVDRRDYQYLYQDGTDFVFMDQTDYDQVTVPGSVVGDAANFMLENQQVTLAMHEGSPLYLDLPASVNPSRYPTPRSPVPAGRPLDGGTKPATLETGTSIQVPLFLETWHKVKVDTRTGGLPRSRERVRTWGHAPRRASARSICSTSPMCDRCPCRRCSTRRLAGPPLSRSGPPAGPTRSRSCAA